MVIAELLIISVGLAMDAFAVSIGKGLSLRSIKLRHVLSAGLWFGGFQALMPLIGYMLGATFSAVVSDFDHWVAFFLLGIIGFNMIRDSFSKEEDNHNDDFSFKVMLMLAIATSIDAFIVGISFSMMWTIMQQVIAILAIFIATFLFSFMGVKMGEKVHFIKPRIALFTGGAILILIGVKTLIEHLYF